MHKHKAARRKILWEMAFQAQDNGNSSTSKTTNDEQNHPVDEDETKTMKVG